MMNNPRILRQLAVAAAVLLLAAVFLIDVASACPTCKDGVEHAANGANLVRGYFWSIVFMMSMPFLIFASLSAYFYLLVRRARAEQAAENFGEDTLLAAR